MIPVEAGRHVRWTIIARLRVLVVVLFVAGCVGDAPAMAEVNGHSYGVGPVRGLRITEADLTSFATLERTNVDEFFLNREVLTIEDVDPQTLMLVRAAPALRNDPEGTWGDFVGLWGGGQDPDVCAYVERSSLSFCQ